MDTSDNSQPESVKEKRPDWHTEFVVDLLEPIGQDHRIIPCKRPSQARTGLHAPDRGNESCDRHRGREYRRYRTGPCGLEPHVVYGYTNDVRQKIAI